LNSTSATAPRKRFEGGGTGAHVEEQAMRGGMIPAPSHHHAVKPLAHRQAGVIADDGCVKSCRSSTVP